MDFNISSGFRDQGQITRAARLRVHGRMDGISVRESGTRAKLHVQPDYACMVEWTLISVRDSGTRAKLHVQPDYACMVEWTEYQFGSPGPGPNYTCSQITRAW